MTTCRIRRLPAQLINHIAAGEVVERPASVAKELCENAIDAGARWVRVRLAGGGRDGLWVADDGGGMTPREARLALERHATSKLASSADLARIATLGFRGEALAAIASVAELRLTTARAGETWGSTLTARFGEVGPVRAVGAPPGTCVEVGRLFANLPARRKFLRSPATEQAHLVEAVRRIFLGDGAAGVSVEAGGRRLLDIPADRDPVVRVQAALGPPTAAPVHLAAAGADGVRLEGLLWARGGVGGGGRPAAIFVNRRFVRDRLLQRAVAAALPPSAAGRPPAVLVWLTLPLDRLDINVHPQKQEVRLLNPGGLYTLLLAALAPRPAVGARPARAAVPASAAAAPAAAACPHAAVAAVGAAAAALPAATAGATPHGADAPAAAGDDWLALGDGWLVVRDGRRAWLLDGAGLARREALAAWRQELAAGPVAAAPLRLPAPVQLDPAGRAWAHLVADDGDTQAAVAQLGLRLRQVGAARLLLLALPGPLAPAASAEALASALCAAAAGGAAPATWLPLLVAAWRPRADAARLAAQVAAWRGAAGADSLALPLTDARLRRLFAAGRPSAAAAAPGGVRGA